jgi:hypothetical protein
MGVAVFAGGEKPSHKKGAPVASPTDKSIARVVEWEAPRGLCRLGDKN